MADRKATTVWEGGLDDGEGTTSLDSSGLASYDVTWARRTGDPEGHTSPEELLAAAHSSCFSMAFANALSKHELTPERIETSAVVTLVPGTGITKVALSVQATVSGADDDAFQEAVEAAKEGCPVSGLFEGGSAEITYEVARA
jgi:lipoyl-dependent peroxiredoxin